METVFIFLGLMAVVMCQLNLVPPEEMRKVIRYNTECQKKSGATQQEIMATIQGTFSDTPALKDHIFCMGLRLKLITEDGQIQRESIRTKMIKVLHDETKIDKILDKCIVQRDDPKDIAYDSIKCFSQNRDMILNT